MAKYIDADKLIAEIERLIKVNQELKSSRFTEGIAAGYGDVLSAITSLQQEQPEEICSKCIHHGKDDDYCYNPHGGMQSLINENGVYECTGFCEKEQERQEVDLEKEIDNVIADYSFTKAIDSGGFKTTVLDYAKIAHHFYELGLKAKEE